VEQNGWIFARKQNGYLALLSQQPYFWNEGDETIHGIKLRKQEDSGREVIAPGRQNIWICQLGRSAEDGPLEQFIQSICQADPKFNGLQVEYNSPGNGLIQFGWEGGLSVDEIEVQLHGYPRYANPYVQADFNATEIKISSERQEFCIQW
jgi:hypothetical protein